MGARFFQNGSDIGSSAGWGGWTGNNNYVIRYDFRTPSAGASAVTIELQNIYTGKYQGSEGWGFKISTSSTAYANARNESPDSNVGYMQYSDSIGWHCTLSASGLNLPPNTTYYLFVYVATGGAEYYQGWNCTNPAIYTSGAYTPPDSTLSSINKEVTTGQNVNIVMNNPSGLTHTATFQHDGITLATSESFGNTLNFPCPREWMRENTYSDWLNISVDIRNSLGNTIKANFKLTADSGMKPVLQAGAAFAEPINPASAPADIGFLAGLSRAKVTFDSSKIDMSATAGATIIHKEIRWSGKVDDQEPYETGILTDTSKITISVSDSRGRKAESVIEIKMTPYVQPSINNSGATRCNQDGSEAQGGQYYKVIGTTVFTPLDGKNSVKVFASIKATGQDYTGEVELKGWQNGIWSDKWAAPSILGGGLYGDSYTVRLRVTDRVGGSSEVTARLYRQEWLIKSNPTGTALGVGMRPTGVNTLELPEEWKIMIGGVNIAQAIANQIIGKLYQVGDYYITESDTDPNVRFGGTWVRVKGRFLKGTTDGVKPGSEFGADYHKHSTGDHILTIDEIPAHSHSGLFSNGYEMKYTVNSPAGGDYLGGYRTDGWYGFYTGDTGGGGAHNHGDTGWAENNPPYRYVNIWRKTA